MAKQKTYEKTSGQTQDQAENQAEAKAKAKSDDELTAEFEAEIAKYEQVQKAKARVFDPHELLKRAGEVREVEHPVLGLVRFGELTFEDAFEISKCETDIEKTETVAWLMMRKAYPDLPKDFMKRMPLIESAMLVDLLTKQPSFLSAQKTSRSGLTSTQEHRS